MDLFGKKKIKNLEEQIKKIPNVIIASRAPNESDKGYPNCSVWIINKLDRNYLVLYLYKIDIDQENNFTYKWVKFSKE